MNTYDLQIFYVLEGVKCPPQTDIDLFTSGQTLLTNDPEPINWLVDTFRPAIGEITAEHLLTNLREENPRPYGIYQHQGLEIGADDLDSLVYVINAWFFGVLRYVSCGLWLANDTSYEIEEGFLIVVDHNAGQMGLRRFPGRLKLSNCRGEFTEVKFEPQQFTLACKNAVAILEMDSGKKFEEIDQQKIKGGQFYSRETQAWELLLTARSDAHLPNRILKYTMCLESLLSRGTSSEIAHTVAERAAVLLGQSGAHRMDYYDKIKKAYDIRSRVAHGDIIRRTDDHLYSSSQACDEVLRQLMAMSERKFKFKFLTDHTTDSEFNRLFMNHLFDH